MMTALYMLGKRIDSHIIFIFLVFVNMRSGESDFLMYLPSLGLFSRTWSRVFPYWDFFYAHKPLAVRGQDK